MERRRQNIICDILRANPNCTSRLYPVKSVLLYPDSSVQQSQDNNAGTMCFQTRGGGIVGVEKTLSLSCNSKEREPVLRRLRVTPLGERGGQKESRDNI